MTSRRAFLIGIGSALAAPAIVRADSLMKLWVPKPEIEVPLMLGGWWFSPLMRKQKAELIRLRKAVIRTCGLDLLPA